MATEQEFLDTLKLAVRRSKHEISPAGGVGKKARFAEPSRIIMHNKTKPRLSDPRDTMAQRRDTRIAMYRNMEESGQSTSPQSSETFGLLLVTLATEPKRSDEPGIPTSWRNPTSRRRLYSSLKKSQSKQLHS